MKKTAYTLILVFTIGLLFSSCKSHQRCAAYSQAPQSNTQTPS